MEKMDKGEIVFHLAVPFLVFALTFSVGYYVVTLAVDIMQIA